MKVFPAEAKTCCLCSKLWKWATLLTIILFVRLRLGNFVKFSTSNEAPGPNAVAAKTVAVAKSNQSGKRKADVRRLDGKDSIQDLLTCAYRMVLSLA